LTLEWLLLSVDVSDEDDGVVSDAAVGDVAVLDGAAGSLANGTTTSTPVLKTL